MDAGRVPSAAPADLLSKASVLRRLELDVTRRIEGALTGAFRSYGRGPGSERVGARRYEPGDDAHRLLAETATPPTTRLSDTSRTPARATQKLDTRLPEADAF